MKSDTVRVTWKELVAIEPRLAHVASRAREFSSCSCGDPLSGWYGYGRHYGRGLKESVARLAGWDRTDEPVPAILKSAAAYDTAYEHVLACVRREHGKDLRGRNRFQVSGFLPHEGKPRRDALAALRLVIGTDADFEVTVGGMSADDYLEFWRRQVLLALDECLVGLGSESAGRRLVDGEPLMATLMPDFADYGEEPF